MNLDRPESEIETWPIALLLPQAIEATIYSAELVKQIAASMAQFGFEGACLVADDGELVTGHARVLAANMIGRKTVPVIQRRLDQADRRGWRVWDEKWTLSEDDRLAAAAEACREILAHPDEDMLWDSPRGRRGRGKPKSAEEGTKAKRHRQAPACTSLRKPAPNLRKPAPA